VPSSAVTECMSADAVNGQPLAFTVDGTVMVNDATVTTADVNTSNGIIHVIDKVLTPTDAHNDIARTAGCTGVHTSLVAALIQAELVATLQGEGPFTVFAPTDEAFAAAGIDLAALDTEEGKATLTDILLYHVHAGSVMAADLSNGLAVEMVNGDNTTVGDGAVLNGANITLADVKAANGVIHVIDMVLMPPADEVEDTTDTDNEALSDGDDSNIGTVLIAVGALVIVAAVGVLLFLRQRRPGVDLASAGIINTTQPMGSMMATTEVAQTASAYTATTSTTAAQPVAQTTTQSANPDVGVVQQWTDMNGYTWRTMEDGSTLWWTGSTWEKYA
ncbi:MAG: fasciclin domain-containing protein, partial [Candidatus Poseidoniaceae archaeon]